MVSVNDYRSNLKDSLGMEVAVRIGDAEVSVDLAGNDLQD